MKVYHQILLCAIALSLVCFTRSTRFYGQQYDGRRQGNTQQGYGQFPINQHNKVNPIFGLLNWGERKSQNSEKYYQSDGYREDDDSNFDQRQYQRHQREPKAQDNQINYIRNYDFSLPALSQQYQIYNSIPEWETNQIQKGVGGIYNGAWGQTQVIELDGNQNNFMRQKINLRKGKYTIEVKYAARVGYASSSSMLISWNGKVVKQIKSTDELIHVERIEVQASNGQNVVEIRGEWESDSYGMTVAYIKLASFNGITPFNESSKSKRQERKNLTMKKGSYRIFFDWQSKKVEGEIEVILNTITIAVLRPYNKEIRKQIVYAEACEGRNLLIFKIAGENTVNMQSIEFKQ